MYLQSRKTTNTKKVMSTIQKFTFLGQIWAKMTKNAILGYKNGQKYHLWSWFHETTTMPDVKHKH